MVGEEKEMTEERPKEKLEEKAQQTHRNWTKPVKQKMELFVFNHKQSTKSKKIYFINKKQFFFPLQHHFSYQYTLWIQANKHKKAHKQQTKQISIIHPSSFFFPTLTRISHSKKNWLLVWGGAKGPSLGNFVLMKKLLLKEEKKNQTIKQNKNKKIKQKKKPNNVKIKKKEDAKSSSDSFGDNFNLVILNKGKAIINTPRLGYFTFFFFFGSVNHATYLCNICIYIFFAKKNKKKINWDAQHLP
ncbi:hypothetical protein RFI_03518 [Reticulomyxa filosa]|uniref:Uncharacterized protein n=1 Tax=Reticulomyxa filosa TaxID=46433 RepID=X6P4W5_RETFI|nr:hypothetical protein RFI_03518 [Reticulomyxa filosa]|eukprot:ETO33585.1 hypothetical protein RFI_03518 [Reticulomyxa filosa]